jgi:intracellular multiplication protein IcmT
MDSRFGVASWRDSARELRFFILPGQAVLPIFVALLVEDFWAWVLALVTTVFFSVLHRFGFKPMVFLRIVKCFIAGNVVSSRPWWS